MKILLFKTDQLLNNIQEMEHNEKFIKNGYIIMKKNPYLHQEWSLILFQLNPFLQKKLKKKKNKVGFWKAYKLLRENKRNLVK